MQESIIEWRLVMDGSPTPDPKEPLADRGYVQLGGRDHYIRHRLVEGSVGRFQNGMKETHEDESMPGMPQ